MKILSIPLLFTLATAQQEFISVDPFLSPPQSFQWSTAGVGAAAGTAFFSGKAVSGFWRDNNCAGKFDKLCVLVCGGGALLNVLSVATMAGLAGHVYEQHKLFKRYKSVVESHYEAVEAISLLLEENGCQLVGTTGYLGQVYSGTSDNATLTWMKEGEVVKREFAPGRALGVLTEML